MDPTEKPDTSIVQTAMAATGTAQIKFDNAKAAVARAEAEFKAAQAAYDAAVASAADGEVVDHDAAVAAVQGAAGRLEFANNVAGRLLDALDAAQRGQINAQAEAHRGVFLAGKDARLSAAARIDAALAEFQAALAEYQRGAHLIGQARANGFRVQGTESLHPAGHLHDLVHRVVAVGSTAAAEAAFWAERRI
jgi:hypothetical protein